MQTIGNGIEGRAESKDNEAEGRRDVWNRLRDEISALEEDGRWIMEEDSLTEPTGDERVAATILEKVKDDVIKDTERVQDAAEDTAVTVLEKATVDAVQDEDGMHDEKSDDGKVHDDVQEGRVVGVNDEADD